VLARLTSLSLKLCACVPDSAPLLRVFEQLPGMAALQRLSLHVEGLPAYACGLSARMAAELAAALRPLTGLRALSTTLRVARAHAPADEQPLRALVQALCSGAHSLLELDLVLFRDADRRVDARALSCQTACVSALTGLESLSVAQPESPSPLRLPVDAAALRALTRLTALSLRRVDLLADAPQLRLLHAPPPALRRLALRSCGLADKALEVARTLAALTVLESLDLRGNRLCAEALGAALSGLARLTELRF
jgi:hypothetical protein